MDYRCVLIDDKIRSLDLIESYISRIKNWDVANKFINPVDAIGYLKENEIDIVFIDIQMPQINGLELIKLLTKSELVVITTAYDNFGSVAYDLNVIDYLVKPFTFERFLETVKKIETTSLGKQSRTNNLLQLRCEGKLVNIKAFDILYIEGSKEYVKIHTRNRSFLIHERMHEIEAQLPPELFHRIHKSYIINKNDVIEFNNEQIMLTNKIVLPISRIKKDEIIAFLKKK